MTLTPGDDAGEYAGIIGDSGYSLADYGYLVLDFTGRFYKQSADTEYFSGVGNTAAMLPTDYIGIWSDEAENGGFNYTNFYLVVSKDSTETKSAAVTLYNQDGLGRSSYYTHRIEISAEAVRWYVDGVLKATITTNIPNDVSLKPLMRIDNVGGTGDDDRAYYRHFKMWNTRTE